MKSFAKIVSNPSAVYLERGSGYLEIWEPFVSGTNFDGAFTMAVKIEGDWCYARAEITKELFADRLDFVRGRLAENIAMRCQERFGA